MEQRNAIVTGGLRGLGRAMALGLGARGLPGRRGRPYRGRCRRNRRARLPGTPLAGRVHAAGRRSAPTPSECDRVVAAAQERLGGVDILVNNAGLTFTYYRSRALSPADNAAILAGRRRDHRKRDRDQLSRRPTDWRAGSRRGMVERGWGRIVNVTTKLDTMNRAGTHPYGASKAALEMATEVWAKEAEGTGLTINIVNPGAGANTPGMAEEMRAMSREGRARAPRRARRDGAAARSMSSRAKPTPSMAGASTPISGTLHSRPPKPRAAPAAPPASNCTISRVEEADRFHCSGKPARLRPTF